MQAEDRIAEQEKKPYATPKLTEHGTVGDITERRDRRPRKDNRGNRKRKRRRSPRGLGGS